MQLDVDLRALTAGANDEDLLSATNPGILSDAAHAVPGPRNNPYDLWLGATEFKVRRVKVVSRFILGVMSVMSPELVTSDNHVQIGQVRVKSTEFAILEPRGQKSIT